MTQQLSALFHLLLLAGGSSSFASARQLGVSATVQTGWRSSVYSPLLEAAEHVEEYHGADVFWSLVAAAERRGAEALVDAAAVRAVLAPLVDKLALGIVNASLGSRAMAPRVEFFASVASAAAVPCATFAVVSGQQPLCKADGVGAAIAAAAAAAAATTTTADAADRDDPLFTFDHRYPSASPAGAPRVVVYGRLGTPSLARFHAAAKAAADAGDARYVLRLTLGGDDAAASTTSTVALGGFGIALDIKSMEYKALDDSAPLGAMDAGDGDDGTAAEAKAESSDDDAETAGVIFSTLTARYPDLKDVLRTVKDELAAEEAASQSADGAELKVWDMTDLGLQATQRIMAAADPLLKLREISQNFPVFAKQLSRVSVDAALREEVSNLRSAIFLEPGTNSLIVNGVPYPSIETVGFNAFALISDLAKASSASKWLGELSLDATQRTAFGGLLSVGGPLAAAGSDPVRVNVRTKGKGAVHFFNNIEKDKAYKKWPRAMETLMTPSWSLHQLRRNIYTTIIVGNPVEERTLSAIKDMLAVVTQLIPIRLGLVFTNEALAQWAAASPDDLINSAETYKAGEVSNLDDGENRAATTLEFLALMNLLKKNGTHSATNKFLKSLASGAGIATSRDFTKGPVGARKLTVAALRDAFAKATRRKWKGPDATAFAEEVLNGDSAPLSALATRAALWTGTKNLPLPCVLVNGRVVESFDAADAVRSVMPTIGDELQRMQMLVQRGKMRGKKKLNILSIILKGKNVHERYNAQVLQADAEFTPLLPSLAPPAADLPLFLSVEKDAKQPSAVVSALVVADFSTPAALRLALVSLEALSATASMRVALVHNGNSAADAVGRAVRDVTLALALRSSTADDGAAALDDFKRALGGALLDCATGASSASKCTAAKLLAAVKATAGPPSARVAQLRVAAHGNACASWLKLDAGVSALVVNGRVLRLDPLLPTLQVEDIVLAVTTERKRSAKSVAALLRKSGASADAVMATASVLGAMAFSGSVGSDGHTRSLKLRQSGVAPSYLERTVIRASEDAADDATVEVFAILDPLSETAQRASGVLTWLRETMGPDRVSITIVLNPSTSTSELPLSRFYRFVGGAALGTEPTATFLNMPGQHLLTMKIETPEAWIVQASEAEHDLDNIRLGDETLMGDRTTLHATFAMKKLLATGQCHDVTSRVPPNGLQLNLFDASTSAAGDSSPVADTLVMQNLGYFQLQAVPGRWHIKLAEGRATELFEMAPADETSAPAQHLEVLVHDFVDSARMSQLSVRKQAGKEMEELLVKKGGGGADGESGGSLWSKMSSLVTGKKPKSALETGDAEDETVHVFSLASGHLYERLMRIMMLSVTKRTSAPVKFWLVENFLSPHFKRTVFEMAEKFGFEVELITYKWPEWLRRQTEKQRIIWGYKILFLDVLFPLNVHKIIYVDADQVVRADLKELWDLDLQGAPYGYTPMCKTNPETVGFQFWEQGYWKEHLQGKPYHISALYVVDLDVFRQGGVADMLRGTYDQLSRDPNSLSNLDQDLPNYAQHQVPIFSLPQEWLWCESWCSGSSKSKAKTVDLCNNPLHKEPKLDMAKRIISGPLFKESWVELDDEVRSFMEGHAAAAAAAAVEAKSEL